MKIKAFQCLLICLASLLTHSGCSQAFLCGGSPHLSKVPRFPGEMHPCKYNQQQSKDGMCPQPPCFSLAVTPVAVQASGCRVTDPQAGPALGVRQAPAHLQQVLQGRGCSLEWWHCSPASSYRPAQLRQQLSSLPCSLLTTEFI